MVGALADETIPFGEASHSNNEIASSATCLAPGGIAMTGLLLKNRDLFFNKVSILLLSY